MALDKISKVGKFAGNVLLKDNKKGKAMANLYTGKKLRGGLIGAGVVAAGYASVGGASAFGAQALTPELASSANTILGSQSIMAQKRTPAEQAINPSILAAGRATQGNSKAPTLNATGDMVFGMHNRR